MKEQNTRVSYAPLADYRINRNVRSVEVQESFLLFNPDTGHYLGLYGGAAQLWKILSSPRHVLENAGEWGDYLLEFESRGLILGSFEHIISTQERQVKPGDFVDHDVFVPLILHDPEIDSPLLRAKTTVTVPDPRRAALFKSLNSRLFFNALREEADEYCQVQEMTEFAIRIGPALVLIKIPATKNYGFTEHFSEAFFREQLTPSDKPEYTITVFDESVWNRKANPSFGEDWHFPLGIVSQSSQSKVRVAIDRHTQTVSAFSLDTRECVVWMKDFEQLPYWSAATPLRLQLSWIADSLDLEFLHSAAVKVDEKAILFSGPSGSGKSTLAVKLAGLGFPLVADDFLLADQSSVRSVFQRIKVHPWSAQRVVPDHWRIINADRTDQKRIVEPTGAMVQGRVPIGAIVVPFVGSSTSLFPIGIDEALQSIAPASLSGLLGGNRESLQRIARLVSTYPVFGLEVEPGLLEDSELLLSIVKKISDASVPRSPA